MNDTSKTLSGPDLAEGVPLSIIVALVAKALVATRAVVIGASFICLEKAIATKT